MRRTLLVTLIVTTLAVSSCRKPPKPQPPAPPPPAAPTAAISVTPATIEEGKSATLTWNSTHAKSATISGLGNVEPNGSRQVNPTQTTAYNFSATGDGGVANASTTLNVNRVTLPTVGIRANPTQIKTGESTTLSWTSSNADRVSIDNGIGPVDATGSRTVRPTATTRYTATATSKGGDSQNSVEVVVTATPIAIEELFAGSFRDVFFDYDKHDIRDDAAKTLQEDFRWLKQIEQERGIRIRFRIEGHTDERGTTEYNLALGDRRATASKSYLVSLGLPADRITEVISYGEERPFVKGGDEASWAQNRRVHFVFVP